MNYNFTITPSMTRKDVYFIFRDNGQEVEFYKKENRRTPVSKTYRLTKEENEEVRRYFKKHQNNRDEKI